MQIKESVLSERNQSNQNQRGLQSNNSGLNRLGYGYRDNVLRERDRKEAWKDRREKNKPQWSNTFASHGSSNNKPTFA